MAISSRIVTGTSVALLGASAVANAILLLPQGGPLFPFFFWIHVAIIALGLWGMARIRKLQANSADIRNAFSPTPKALLVAGVAVAAFAVLAAPAVITAQGTLPDGTPIHAKNWSERGGKYWLSVNGQASREITKAEYDELQRENYAFFAFVWLILSYVVLLQWHFIMRAESARANSHD